MQQVRGWFNRPSALLRSLAVVFAQLSFVNADSLCHCVHPRVSNTNPMIPHITITLDRFFKKAFLEVRISFLFRGAVIVCVTILITSFTVDCRNYLFSIFSSSVRLFLSKSLFWSMGTFAFIADFGRRKSTFAC